MNLIVKGRGVELNDRLRGYATDKLTKVQRFFERIIQMEVELSQETNPRVREKHKVDVTVKTPRETLRAHGAGGDYFAAIDQAADRLEVQIKKFKDRLNHRGHQRSTRGEQAPTAPPAEAEDEMPLVRVPQQVARPMTPEEALLELDARGLQFLLFTNAETMAAGVVFRRDGGYGLIEHEG